MTTSPITDYQKTIRVQAPPGALFDALATASGLTAWWTGAAGSGDTGGELQFFMSAPEPLLVHVVDEAAVRQLEERPNVWLVSELPSWVRLKEYSRRG